MLAITSRCELVGVGIASFSNSLLLYMLTFKATSSYGSYRRLMLSYTIVEIMYTFFNKICGMMAHSTETSFVVFNVYQGYVSRSLAPIFLLGFCAIYYTLITLLVVHFIYRYIVICDSAKLKYFDGGYLLCWVFGCAACGISMVTVKYFAFPQKERLTNELRDDFSQYYNLTMEEVVYNGPNYYNCDENGKCEISLVDWITMIIFCCGLMFSVIIMFCCGYFCCMKLEKNKLNASHHTVQLQKQLMIALIIQSLIPITLMYIPILILFVTPMIRIAAGPYVNIAIATVAIYPPVDQFAIIYVIKDFRTAVKS
nr:hypothetical protein F59E11.15 - Caenorhabditis elegans [Caenorhabditis elegans]